MSDRGSESENPVIPSPTPAPARPSTNQDWWPNQLNLQVLHQHSPRSNPLDETFDYAEEFKGLDVEALKQDVLDVMTKSQDWWPADYGHYGPLFIRMSWHAAGTYRIEDGRGGGGDGHQRFAPLNSWPDNANLDKARRLLWPVKQKYGQSVSWADLLVFTGNVALESMGFKTFGFGFGRPDVWEPEEIFWGPGHLARRRALQRRPGTRRPVRRRTDGPDLREPGGSQREPGSSGVRAGHPGDLQPDGDERRGDSRAHRRRSHVRQVPRRGRRQLGRPRARGLPRRTSGLGWKSTFGSGKGKDTITSGLEGAWTPTPTTWDNSYFETLFGHEWELTSSPAGAHQWKPKDGASADAVPAAHDPSVRVAPMMLTSDLALRLDPIYEPISRRFMENPNELADAFAKAWYKLLHRDMGPVARYLGPWVPEPQIWQDPVPAVDHELVADEDIAALKGKVLESGLSVSQLVSTAWASAASFRRTDKRGGANGARIRLEPQRNWEANDPAELAVVLQTLEQIQKNFNASQPGGTRISLADLIVLGGCAGVEQAAKNAGYDVTVPFVPGRTDASQEQTDAESFAVLEPRADGFRNYLRRGEKLSPETLLLDRANMLELTAPEMTVLVGGMRALGANYGRATHGLLTDRPETLTNDFFVNLLDMGTDWKPSESAENVFDGTDRATDEVKWSATAVDLLFGSNSQLRAIAEVYASADAEKKFVSDFISAWVKVMNLDRFDLA